MRRVIAGDVGGTKTLLRCVEVTGQVLEERRFESGAFRSFDDLLAQFLANCPGTVDSACFAVAGPVFGTRAELTNLGWRVDAQQLANLFQIRSVSLINDFYAIALGMPLLAEDDLVPLQSGHRQRAEPMAVLGAGTGLGQAMVTFHGAAGWGVIPGEGGHADFAPQDEEQARLFLALQRKYGHVSWERLLSGMGLANIHEFLTGRAEEPSVISELAARGDGAAVRTMQIFVDIYGAEAGNMALRMLARGGVFLAGGIATKNIPFFTDGRFVAAFTRKGRFSDLVRTIPVDLVVNETVGLMGAVEQAKRN
ncbi:MAG TPA: glucokinase [Thermoanaerobaculia bacterium]|nr:glucokinase [Thermoanaerobaculia bacterium]